jgi:hypothetical protein
MIIKSFKLFESNSENNFPDLEEIKSYLYDFTDESDTFVDDYEFGYVIFERAGGVSRNSGLNPHLSEQKTEFIDILKSDLSDYRLEYICDLIRLNDSWETKSMVTKSSNQFYEEAINLIESGKAPRYEYIYIHFNNFIFDVDKLEVLLECLETIYSHTGFRPVSSLWSEDYVSDISGEVETKYGFEGTFVRVSDQEYNKFCNIFKRGDKTPLITKLFKDTRYNN